MANDKFKGCFIDESSLYAYDIEYEGALIAKARTLSAKHKSVIEQKSMTKSFADGKLAFDVNTPDMKTQTILAALTEWQLDRPLSEDSISLLTERVRDHLYDAIQAHETSLTGVVEDTEKN